MYWDSSQEDRGRGSVRTWVTQRHLDHRKHSPPTPKPNSWLKDVCKASRQLHQKLPLPKQLPVPYTTPRKFHVACQFLQLPGSFMKPLLPPARRASIQRNSHTTFHPFLGLLDSFLCNVLGAFEEMIMTSGYFPSFMTKHGATMPWQASHRIWGWTAVTNTDGLLWHRP